MIRVTMPTNIKFFISALVAVVGAGAYYLETFIAERSDLGILAAALAVFMIVAMWIFPETESNKGRETNDQL